MASYFTLNLDTTGPAGVSISLAAAATYTAVRAITATIATSDSPTTGYQIKLWGDVDNSVDSNIQTTEGSSVWTSYTTSKSVTLSTGDALKTVNLKVRDPYGNETSASDTITLDASLPVITITGPDLSTISKVAGFRVSSFSFSPDTDLTAYKVKVVPATSSIESAGTTIGTTNGSTNMTGTTVSAGGTVNCTIDGRDLEAASAGDGAKIIKVFGQEASGNWSV